MRFTVERINSGYLITDADAPYGERRYHVDSFLLVLKALAQNAYIHAPDVKIFGMKPEEHVFRMHSVNGFGKPHTGFSYGLVEGVKSFDREKYKELCDKANEIVKQKAGELVDRVYTGQGMRSTTPIGPKQNPPFVEKWLEKMSNGSFLTDMITKYNNLPVGSILSLLKDLMKLDQNE